MNDRVTSSKGPVITQITVAGWFWLLFPSLSFSFVLAYKLAGLNINRNPVGGGKKASV